MSERALSKEINKEISAMEAHKKSLYGELRSAKAFYCHGSSCGIDLTCTGWKNKDAQRIYFTPSSREHLHSILCSVVTLADEKEFIKIETNDGKKTISKSGIISMKKANEQSHISGNNETTPDDKNIKNIGTRNKACRDKNNIENRNISSIKTYINFYFDDEINNDALIVSVDGELISLNKLFVDAAKIVKKGVNRIFYGKAIVETTPFNAEMIMFKFVDREKQYIYTNKRNFITRISVKVLNKYLDKGNQCNLFFRGCIDEQGKFVSFNGKNYCDLYIVDDI